MAINVTTTASANHNAPKQFVPLNALPKGTGEIGRYKTDVTGVLLGIEPRGGSYEVKDRRTGAMIRRPNSWTAHFADGSMFSWPTYVDPADNRVKMWSRFDASIDLAVCIQQGIAIHVWKDDRNFCHLEIAATQQLSQQNAVPVPEDDMPWDYQYEYEC